MSSSGADTRLRIDGVIRRVHEALVEVKTRDELEAAVCRAFADSEPYVFAWIGVHDTDTNAVVPSAIAGTGQEYLDEISIALDDSAEANGPTAVALRTGTTQIMQRIRDDPDYEPWREQALAHGFESSSAIPLVEGDLAYGVLNVYSGRPEAFEASEQTLLAELGATIGTAIGGVLAREDLEAQKRQYEQLTERISDAYYAVDSEWEITYWNDQMADRTDVSAADALGERLWTAFPEIVGTEAESNYRAAMETNEPQSFEMYVEAPFDYWVEVDVHPDEDGLSIFSREITERKQRERELTEAKRRLDAIVHNTSEAIYIKNRESEYVFINEVGADIFDETPETVVGKTDDELFDTESADAVRADDRHVFETGSGETWERVRYVDGTEHVFIDNKFPYRDESGEIIGLVGVSRDITERKAYEQQLEEQRDGLDLLNKVVRHDIRNNLQVVLGYGDLLGPYVDADGNEHLTKILNNAESAVELTHTAADLAEVMVHPDRDPTRVCLDDILQTQITEVCETFDGATVAVAGSLPAVEVLADDMLSSVFRNLLKNAVQHNDKDVPEVTVSAAVDDDAGAVTVRVADNGPGVPEDLRPSIFGKGEKGLDSEGTGVGLYLVRTLVEAYGGDVWIEDETAGRPADTRTAPAAATDAEGAVFAVELPIA
ncbi:PAS domain-containing protein [Halobellus inordinatus]|uniref:PAS domain-containing protein n=1 Tax=Halobellus inordinatus TaxID=1126236 RepID=UPI00210D02BD|nr:PAS domain-containing protein [Halobellus inordinatus]